jgi:glycosyltransferase involved in cell wall biosynthesis
VTTGRAASDPFTVLPRPYLIVTNIPYFVDESDVVLLDRAWHHDLVQHTAYLPDLTVVAPRAALPAPGEDLVPLGQRDQTRPRLVSFARAHSRLQALYTLMPTLRTVWTAVRKADVVHSGLAGWPYPMGWIAIPMARLLSKKTVVVVESAPWRSPREQGDPLLRQVRKRVEAFVFERMARWCCSMADVSFYTQPSYRDEFHGSARSPAYVTPATWINEEDLLQPEVAQSLWQRKRGRAVRFLFAGRLVAEKGVHVLLSAVDKLADRQVSGAIDILGDGPLRETVRAAAAASAARQATFRLSYLEPVPYGAPFFGLLEQYHALVVPSLGDEQPRIIFDAAARAVPVIASATNGLAPYVTEARMGRLVPPGDVDALAEAMQSWATDPAPLEGLAMEALAGVQRHTHRAMHANRSKLLALHI